MYALIYTKYIYTSSASRLYFTVCTAFPVNRSYLVSLSMMGAFALLVPILRPRRIIVSLYKDRAAPPIDGPALDDSGVKTVQWREREGHDSYQEVDIYIYICM